MKKFVLFLRANKNMSPAAFSDPKEIELRKNWLENIQTQGFVTDLGGTMPPTPEMAITLFSNGISKEGPFTENIHFLTGYIIVQAKHLEAAKEIAQSNPILLAGGSVEIREIILRAD